MAKLRVKRGPNVASLIRKKLELLKEGRRDEERSKRFNKQVQGELIPLMRSQGSDDLVFGFEYEGERFGAKVTQNEASTYWSEDLIPALQENGLWDEVKSEVLDSAKLEAAITLGKIDKDWLDDFQVEGDRPAPYVRFVSPPDEEGE